MKSSSILKKLLPQIESCVYCGMCQNVCPIHMQSGREVDGPRGRLALLRGWLDGILGKDEIAPPITACLLCGRCSGACPQNLSLPQIFLFAKFELHSALPRAYARNFAKILLLPPGVIEILTFSGSWAQKFLEYIPFINTKKSSLAQLPTLSPAAPHLPWFAKKTEKFRGKSGYRVLLFPGCISSIFYPEIIAAASQSLKSNGFEIIENINPGCCGRPFLTMGKKSHASRLASRILRALAKLNFDFLVTPCPGCLDTIRKIWARDLDLPPNGKEYATELAKKAWDINEFVDAHCQGASGQITEKYWWQQPCLLTEGASASALKLCGNVEKPAVSLCCGTCFTPIPPQGDEQRGSPGDLWIDDANMRFLPQKHAPVSGGKLPRLIKPPVQRKPQTDPLCAAAMSALLASGLNKAASACPGCILKLNMALKAAGSSIVLRHSIQIHHDNIKKNGSH